MGRRLKRRNAIGEGWISYPFSMLESPALRTLSLSAVRVMHRLEVEHMHHGGAENGNLIVTHNQFIEWGIAQNAIAPAIRELVALGLVVITEKGCGGNEKHQRANRFRLTYVNMKSREQPTHEWRKIARRSKMPNAWRREHAVKRTAAPATWGAEDYEPSKTKSRSQKM